MLKPQKSLVTRELQVLRKHLDQIEAHVAKAPTTGKGNSPVMADPATTRQYVQRLAESVDQLKVLFNLR